MSPVADHNLLKYMELAANSSDMRSLLRGFFGCLSHGVNYLHHSKIRHRDIKPANILVKADRVFLTDFGISLDWEGLSGSTTTELSRISPIYCAPEVANEEPRNSASDIWSLGCVFLEMTTVLKKQKITDMRDSFKERTENYRFYSNIEGSAQWIAKLHPIGLELDNVPLNCITKMLTSDPKSRPTADELVSMITNLNQDDGGLSTSTSLCEFCGSCCNMVPDSSTSLDFDWGAWAEDTVISHQEVSVAR
jgi:serine/threonine protein kinase